MSSKNVSFNLRKYGPVYISKEAFDYKLLQQFGLETIRCPICKTLDTQRHEHIMIKDKNVFIWTEHEQTLIPFIPNA